MFNGQSTNNSSKKTANTTIKTLYGELSALGLSYWGDKFSIKINPCNGVNADGIRTYDYNRRAATALTVEKCLSLVKVAKEKLIPSLTKANESKEFGAPINASVDVSNGTIRVVLEVRKEENDMLPHAYLYVYTGVDASTGVAPESGKFAYKFAKTAVETNYDPTSGQSEKNYFDTEFEYFCKKMEETATTLGTSAHSINSDDAIKSSYQGGGNYNKNNAYSGQSNQSPAPSYSAPVSNFNPEEFPFA